MIRRLLLKALLLITTLSSCSVYSEIIEFPYDQAIDKKIIGKWKRANWKGGDDLYAIIERNNNEKEGTYRATVFTNDDRSENKLFNQIREWTIDTISICHDRKLKSKKCMSQINILQKAMNAREINIDLEQSMKLIHDNQEEESSIDYQRIFGLEKKLLVDDKEIKNMIFDFNVGEIIDGEYVVQVVNIVSNSTDEIFLASNDIFLSFHINSITGKHSPKYLSFWDIGECAYAKNGNASKHFKKRISGYKLEVSDPEKVKNIILNCLYPNNEFKSIKRTLSPYRLTTLERITY